MRSKKLLFVHYKHCNLLQGRSLRADEQQKPQQHVATPQLLRPAMAATAKGSEPHNVLKTAAATSTSNIQSPGGLSEHPASDVGAKGRQQGSSTPSTSASTSASTQETARPANSLQVHLQLPLPDGKPKASKGTALPTPSATQTPAVNTVPQQASTSQRSQRKDSSARAQQSNKDLPSPSKQSSSSAINNMRLPAEQMKRMQQLGAAHAKHPISQRFQYNPRLSSAHTQSSSTQSSSTSASSETVAAKPQHSIQKSSASRKLQRSPQTTGSAARFTAGKGMLILLAVVAIAWLAVRSGMMTSATPASITADNEGVGDHPLQDMWAPAYISTAAHQLPSTRIRRRSYIEAALDAAASTAKSAGDVLHKASDAAAVAARDAWASTTASRAAARSAGLHSSFHGPASLGSHGPGVSSTNITITSTGQYQGSGEGVLDMPAASAQHMSYDVASGYDVAYGSPRDQAWPHQGPETLQQYASCKDTARSVLGCSTVMHGTAVL